MRKIVFILVMVLTVWPCSAARYSTSRLHRISNAMRLHVPDTLAADSVYDDFAKYRGRAVRLCTDSYGDISNIGYEMFGHEVLKGKKFNRVAMFVERYMLELDLQLDGRSPSARMDLDDVRITRGTYGMLKQVRAKTQFTVNEVKRRQYTIGFLVGGRRVALTFPANCQLIYGANAIELEKIAASQIRRQSSETPSSRLDDIRQSLSQQSSGDMAIIDGGRYLSNAISGDIYLYSSNGTEKLVCSSRSQSHSISNIMLTGIFERNVPLSLTIDRYGNKTEKIQTSVQALVNFCFDEGCRLYFGIKKIKNGILYGTLFALNESLAFNHMAVIEFPTSVLSGSNDAVKARLYTFIPLQNMTERFFTKNMKDEYIP